MTTKKFKLLQNLPFAEAGTIIEYNSNIDQYIMDSVLIVGEEASALYRAYINNTDWFESIPEPKTQHFHRNGSVCEALAIGTKHYYINNINECDDTTWDSVGFDLNHLASHNVFLTKEACQKAIDDRETYNKLYLKVKQIDAENGFRVEWGIKKEESNWYIYKSHHTFNSKVNWVANWHTSESQQSGQQYHSEQSKDYLLSDAVTDEQREIWINS